MYAAAIFLPLLGAVIAGLFGRALGARWSMAVTCGAMVISAILACVIFYEVVLAAEARNNTVEIFTWIQSGTLAFSWALKFDPLSAIMVFTVSVVSAIIHIYSIGYMSHDPHRPRFFAYLSLFTFSMLMLVSADNLVQLFFGWEGVGLCSYLLIGFWYHKPSANAAAIKAFVVNRVGDFGFALGIFGIFLVFDTVGFEDIFAAVASKKETTFQFLSMEVHALTAIAILLFIGAMGKSAQIFLHTWLPDAMEGPTPVSALIHAATMVTAGVFMVCRMSPLFEAAPTALFIVTLVGASTAFFAATVGLCQTDIKRVIAYSTCSQLGYMFFAAGIGAYSIAIFHLMTHAFFKALLFLGSGSVIHGMSDEQDMRRMGGIWRKMPLTYALMWIGSLALAGIGIPGLIGFAGFHSKDAILEAAFGAHSGIGMVAYWLGIAAAFLTALYSWRLILMTFHGKPRASDQVMSHVHESPFVMTGPLILLAVGAVIAGFLGQDLFTGHGVEVFKRAGFEMARMEKIIEAAHHVAPWVKWLPLIVALAGIACAYIAYAYLRMIPVFLAYKMRGLYQFLLNKWYFDELYDAIFVKPAFYLGRGLWKSGDGAFIDGVGPDGIAAAAQNIAKRASALQTGYLYHYAFSILIGVAAFVTLYVLVIAG
ncbi:MAG TPA: NADH-quinone oxidoreductase subunit L [Alphaproteobacteria bacterium]|nr:NADH-quinone oxidoreductase subunit L [Alphaproteobacteria bacterium]